MARIYRTSDRIKVKIDDLIVTISPLNYHQKAEIQSLLIGFHTGDARKATEAIATALKYAVKDIQGVEDEDGNPYELEFDGDYLSEQSVSDLLNMDVSDKLTMVCSSLQKNTPKQFTDNSGDPIEGVEVLSKDSNPKNT